MGRCVHIRANANAPPKRASRRTGRYFSSLLTHKRVLPPARQRISASRSKPSGSVKGFARDHIFPAEGEQVEIKALMRDYRAWCARQQLTPLGVDAFLDEFAKLCRKLGIETEVGDDQRVYCLDVRVTTNGIEAMTAPH